MNNTMQVCDKFVLKMNNEIQKRIDESSDDLEIEEIQSKFEIKRVAKKRKMASNESDDEPIEEEKKKFTIEIYNRVLDTIIESTNKRFSNNNDLLVDLSLLSPANFNLFKDGLPTDSLTKLSHKIKPFFDDHLSENEIKIKLSEELINFGRSWDFLKKSVDDEYNEQLYISDSENEDQENTEVMKPCNKSCKNCVVCCYNVLIKYNLFSNAYPTLTIAYQYILTLPVTQVACERSFSTLKYLKNRLRNVMTNEHLESFMLMAIENKILINLDNDIIINAVGEKSKLLSKLLL